MAGEEEGSEGEERDGDRDTDTILVFSGCRNKIPQTGGLNSRNFLLTALEAASPSKVGIQA